MGIFKGLKQKKWFQQVLKIAPVIGTALGGPFAGVALNAVAQALGVEPTEEAIEAELAKNPEALLKLKLAEADFKVKMKELDITEQDLYLKDVASAREREMAVKDKMPAVLAVLSVIVFAGMGSCLFFVKDLSLIVDQSQREILFYLLATSQAALLQSYNYYLGSSRGSARKTDVVNAYLMEK